MREQELFEKWIIAEIKLINEFSIDMDGDFIALMDEAFEYSFTHNVNVPEYYRNELNEVLERRKND